MTAAQYRNALAELGLTPTAAARLLGIDERTSRRYSKPRHSRGAGNLAEATADGQGQRKRCEPRNSSPVNLTEAGVGPPPLHNPPLGF
jgi:hypothetical protein